MAKSLSAFFYTLLALWCLLTSVNRVQAQCLMTPIELQERMTNSSIVIEGRVISKKSTWNDDRTLIETHNVIDVFKIFKGTTTNNTLTIITQGGVVGTDMLIVSSALKLNVGDVGVFTLNAANAANSFEPYAASQAFIKYNEETFEAESVFDRYENINAVYSQIEALTSSKITELKPYNIKSRSKNHRGEATPVITNLSPSTLSAGTYSLLTITGTDFGNTAGSVEFPDSNNGGATFITAEASLIQSWSDTEITVFVPTGGTTGSVAVINSTSERGESVDEITVPFNISGLNNSFVQQGDYTPDLVNDNGSGGYTFTFNDNYFSNTDAVDRYDEVIEQWRCESGINWNSNGAATTTETSEGFDNINIVTFDDVNPLPGGVLGTAYSFYNACGTGGVAYWRVSELDIKFDLGTNWNYTLSSPAFSEFDFYSVMLHEMGHAHQLGHTPVVNDVMYFSISNGTEKRVLTANNVSAVNYVMSRNNANELAYNGSTGGSIVANACSNGPMIANGCNVAPTTAFTADNTSTCNSTLTVNFTDQSTGSPTSWSWDFGDGTTSTDEDPTHLFTGPGGFDVSLTTTNANGNNTLTITSFITITDGIPIATACDPTSQNDGFFGQTVSNVTFGSINNSTSTSTNDGYTDFSCDNMTAVESEMTYDLSVTLNAGGPNGDEQCFVYIDYNNDGAFAASERVMNVTQPNGGSGTFTTSITIPEAAVTGTALRMRVVAEAGTLNGPCDNNFIGDAEDYGILINATALPITLSKFDISKNENIVQIDWQTATETNNDFFTIERSKNATDWEEIRTINGAGNSTSLLDYTTEDTRPHVGTSYYRLKQTDYDGQYSYSDIKSINIKEAISSRITLYPNPSSGESFSILMDGATESDIQLYVTDIFGRTVLSKSNLDLNEMLLFDKKLSKGYYVVTLQFGSQKISKTLIVN